MISLVQHRWILVGLVHCIALFIVSQVNHYLAPLGISLSLLALVVAFSALVLNIKQGILSLLPLCLVLEARSPLAYGAFFATTYILFGLIIGFRYQLRRESPMIGTLTAVTANVFVFLALTLATYLSPYRESISYPQTVANLIASSLVISLLARTYFASQLEVLEFFGIRVLEEQRQKR